LPVPAALTLAFEKILFLMFREPDVAAE
jgi:hypothetical protein